MSNSTRIMIAFRPPDSSQKLADKWEQYFNNSILPKFENTDWSQERPGWGWLACSDTSHVSEILTAYGWKMGTNYWGGVRYDPVQQKPPEEKRLEDG